MKKRRSSSLEKKSTFMAFVLAATFFLAGLSLMAWNVYGKFRYIKDEDPFISTYLIVAIVLIWVSHIVVSAAICKKARRYSDLFKLEPKERISLMTAFIIPIFVHMNINGGFALFVGVQPRTEVNFVPGQVDFSIFIPIQFQYLVSLLIATLIWAGLIQLLKKVFLRYYEMYLGIIYLGFALLIVGLSGLTQYVWFLIYPHYNTDICLESKWLQLTAFLLPLIIPFLQKVYKAKTEPAEIGRNAAQF